MAEEGVVNSESHGGGEKKREGNKKDFYRTFASELEENKTTVAPSKRNWEMQEKKSVLRGSSGLESPKEKRGGNRAFSRRGKRGEISL